MAVITAVAWNRLDSRPAAAACPTRWRGSAGHPTTGESRKVSQMANTRQTGKKAASSAGKVLGTKSSTKAEKAAAASALSQTPRQGGRKKR